MDDAYLEGMYEEVSQMYRLAEHRITAGSRDLGPLPGTAVALISVIVLAWVLMGAYVVKEKIKAKKRG